MRRKDREITDFKEQLEILEQCDVCRICLNDESGYPYILPLNFGAKVSGDKVTLYFHGAREGYKYNLITKDNRASFEVDCCHEVYSDKERGYCTFNYKSLIGHGRICIVEDDTEKIEGLTILTDHYHTEHFEFNPAAIPRTTVIKLEVESITGKHKQVKK